MIKLLKNPIIIYCIIHYIIYIIEECTHVKKNKMERFKCISSKYKFKQQKLSNTNENARVKQCENFGFPFVIKPYVGDGSHVDVELIKNKNQLIQYLRNTKKKYLMIQEYCEYKNEYAIILYKYPFINDYFGLIIEKEKHNFNRSYLYNLISKSHFEEIKVIKSIAAYGSKEISDLINSKPFDVAISIQILSKHQDPSDILKDAKVVEVETNPYHPFVFYCIFYKSKPLILAIILSFVACHLMSIYRIIRFISRVISRVI